MFDSKSMLFLAAVLLCACFAADKVQACDDFAGKLLSSYLGPAIKGLGCSALGNAGVDQADHKLESVCYTSTGPTSSVEIVASLHCHTGDKALIPFSASERVTADAEVRGADCSVQKVDVKSSGEIGKVLIAGFDVNGRALKALQDGLNKLCADQK